MGFLNNMLLWLQKSRLEEIAHYTEEADLIQSTTLHDLLFSAQSTEFGLKYEFKDIFTLPHSDSVPDLSTLHSKFKNRVPIHAYDDLKPYIEEMRKGKPNVLWSGNINWFSKSSGTTSDKSKFIPVSKEALEDCHYKGGKDMIAMYINDNPESNILSGKNLAMGGSLLSLPQSPQIIQGDISAIIMKNLPLWAQLRRVPDLDIALMNEWEAKLEKMAKAIVKEDVVSLAGVPSWVMVLLRKMLEMNGKKTMSEIWPNAEVFFHGGVSFTPYREQFNQLMGISDFKYVETYNASEGFFAIQDRVAPCGQEQDMLLMLDYGIFYEFVPVEDLCNNGAAISDNAKCLHIGEVEIGKSYALLITTNAGLWRYLIGDTVVFTSTSPYRIRINGRTKNYINTFGEELMVDNADKALSYACKQTGAEIKDYTAGPVFLDKNESACHQWLIEFLQEPSELSIFTDCLDKKLQELNSDYEAKRHKDILLKKPLVQALPQNTFYNWLKQRGRLGGQNKIPRLANQRTYIDSILDSLK